MKSIVKYINESLQERVKIVKEENNQEFSISNEMINEALITFGKNGNEQKFGQIIIFAGGAGSGKGFIKDNLLGNDGIVLDVDALKGLALKSELINKRILDEYGVSLKDMNLKNSDDVSKLHRLLSENGINLKDRKYATVFNSVMMAHPDRKPNIIFDITMKNYEDLINICGYAEDLGYRSENVNLMWVVNDVEVASQQNADRSRTIDDRLLRSIHSGVSRTMQEIIFKANRICFDGEFYLVFNKKGEDSKLNVKKVSDFGYAKEVVKNPDGKSSYIDFVKYVKIKDRNKAIDTSKIDDVIKAKISEYTQENW